MSLVLIVEDNPRNMKLVRDVLQVKGHETLEATTAEDGIVLAVERRPDLVLMDIQLPDVSGLSLLEELTQRLPQLPVIMLSADHDAGIVHHSLEQGARGFLPKSSLNQVLVSAIRLVAAGGVYVPPEALQKPAARPAAAGPQAPVSIASLGFTARQTDVFRLLLQGLSNKQICRELDLAEPTVKIHVRGILRTLGVSSRAEVIAKYGMLSPSPSTPRQAAAADH